MAVWDVLNEGLASDLVLFEGGAFEGSPLNEACCCPTTSDSWPTSGS